MSTVQDAGELSLALEHAAATAERAAEQQHEAARLARKLAAARRSGQSLQELARTGQLHAATTALSQCAQHLVKAAGQLRRATARALAAEGFSLRQIARHFGVSHQRVSALLSDPDTPGPSGVLSDSDAAGPSRRGDE